MSFPKGSAAGPSGLRPQHLLDALSVQQFFDVPTNLQALVNKMLSGTVPDTVMPYLAGANLLAYRKPGGGVRPIAVGETLRRLVSKCAVASVKDEARGFFAPTQVGVAVPGGVEAAVLAVSTALTENPDLVALKVDFRNAFNEVDRGTFLAEVEEHFPGLSRWAWWCYGKQSYLQFAGEVVVSAAGVQQGDPLGPLLFDLALHVLVRRLEELGLEFQVWYHDDGTLVGTRGLRVH